MAIQVNRIFLLQMGTIVLDSLDRVKDSFFAYIRFSNPRDKFNKTTPN